MASFPTKAAYRAALRDHRPWWQTIALFLVMALVFLNAIYILGGLLSLGADLKLPVGGLLPLWVQPPLAVVLSVLFVWWEAAHRIAARNVRPRL